MKNLKKHFTLVLAFLFACSASFASVVSIQVVQNDCLDKKVHTSSYTIEDTLLDYFFERGAIASTEPIAILQGSDSYKKIEDKALEEAYEGLCDYLIIINADFDTSESKNPSADLLSNLYSLSWKVIDVSDSTTLCSGNKKVSDDKKSKDIATFVRAVAASFAAFVR